MGSATPPADAEAGGAPATIEDAWALLDADRYAPAVQAERLALSLVDTDPVRALPLLARALEVQGDTVSALRICERALAEASHSAEVTGEIGRLALRRGRFELAERALAAHLRAAPSPEAAIDLARVQRGLHAFDRGLATLTAALQADAGQPLLWLALAQLLCAQGRHGEAIVFFDEAVRLDPSAAPALDGLADALLVSGHPEAALDASEKALDAAGARDAPLMLAAHARRMLAAGRRAEGWSVFARAFAGDTGETEIRVAAPRWIPGEPLTGRLLLFGEADVASEILLAHTIPDLIARGPPPILAAHSSWAALARRSFPGAQVASRLTRLEGGRQVQAAELDSPHLHGGELVGAWAPLRAAMAKLRGERAAFAGAAPYLTPDPGRVATWRETLAALDPRPKIGLVWRQPSGESDRDWEAPPLPALAEVFSRHDFYLVGIQAEAVLGQLAWIREALGFPVQDPPPPFLSSDLDEVAALAAALDLVIGAPDSASYVAAASGAQTWFLAPPRHWALLGGETFPWFEAARVISTQRPGDWRDALSELDRALGAFRSGWRGPGQDPVTAG